MHNKRAKKVEKEEEEKMDGIFECKKTKIMDLWRNEWNGKKRTIFSIECGKRSSQIVLYK